MTRLTLVGALEALSHGVSGLNQELQRK